VPELPEVETTCRGIAPYVLHRRIARVVVREPRLRWRVSARLRRILPGQRIESVSRRGKYLLLRAEKGTLIVHLGMSGSLRIVPEDTPPQPHDHVDLVLEDHRILRLRDPRRFGAVLWTEAPINRHRLLAGMGPEPLGHAFSASYLHAKTRQRRRAIRDVLLDGHIVAGVGNIYANEALFAAGIRPTRRAERLNRAECARLVRVLRRILKRAIRAGGTTLRDFQSPEGRPGFFSQKLAVYGRSGERCDRCGRSIVGRQRGGRRVFYCPTCQS